MNTEFPPIAANRRIDPEDRVVNLSDNSSVREKMLDKTVADSFPASDPPSTLPDPDQDSFAPVVDLLPETTASSETTGNNIDAHGKAA